MILASLLLFTMELRSANAVVACPPRRSLVQGAEDLIKKVGIYDGIKPLDEEAFAKQIGQSEAELKSRYGATSVFQCENAAGNGQLIIKGNTVLTVKHTFLKDGESCDKTRDLKKCGFIYKEGGTIKVAYLKRMIASGECKPGQMIDSGNDWAIVELERSMPKTMTPYNVTSQADLQAGKPLTMVGRTSALPPTKASAKYIDYPPAFARCVSFGKDTFKYWRSVQTNCPGANGASGSAILTQDSTPTLVGVFSGELPSKPLCGADPDGNFQKNCRGSLVVPVEGKLLEAIESLKK